jgi:hypothetical protein
MAHAAKIQEDFKGSAPPFVKDLEARRLMSMQMTRLAKGEYACQFPTADVHVERFGVDDEFAELTVDFDGRGAVRNDDMYFAKFFKGADDLLK